MYSNLKRRSKFERSVVAVPFQIFLWSRHTLFCTYLYPFLLPGLWRKANVVIIPLSFLLSCFLPLLFFLLLHEFCFVITFTYYLCKLSLDSGSRHAQYAFSSQVLLIHKISQEIFVAITKSQSL